MAITIIAQPNEYHPVYNPVVYQVDSNIISPLTLPGFRYIFGIRFNGEATETIFKTFPNIDGFGTLDVSKIIQSRIENTIEFNQSTVLSSGENHIDYQIRFGEEYPISWEFDDYSFSYFVQLDGTSTHPYIVGDQITVRIDPSITDNRKVLNGTFNVVEVVDANSIRISLLYTDLGDGATTPGITYYSDRRKNTIYPQGTQSKIAYNEAVPFKDFPNWTESLVLPEGNGYPAEIANILTNSPNYLETQKEKDKYIIKKYQELYWNVFNNPIGDPDTTLANSMICINEFGDRWMLSDYTNFDDASIIMRQFDVSPDNPDWINITPNWGTGTFYTSGFNPYTHINSDSSLSYSKWLEFWPTYAPGYDDCDAIDIEIIQDPTIPGPPTTYFNFTFRPVERGRNLRRIYHTIIDDKDAFLISEIEGATRVWNLYMSDTYNPYTNNTYYNAFAKRTSNSEPFGTSNGNNNNADAWKAFDGDPNTFWQTNDGLGGGILTYNMPFDSAIGWAIPIRYSLNRGGSLTNAPKNWTFEVSEDGSTWTTLHTVAGYTTNGTYNSPTLNIIQAYTRFRIVVSDVVFGLNCRINEFNLVAQSRIARMASGNDCPTSGGFLFWVIQGGPIDEFSTLTLDTSAVLPTTYNDETEGYSTYPTLKKRRVYLDYDCEINTTQLLFLDRAGSYSSFAFPLRVIERGTNEKLTYKNEIGFNEDGQWTYNTYDSETKTYNSKVEKTYTLTTDWLNTSMSDYFEELITSPEVYIKLNSETDNGRDGEGQPTPWLACTVIDTDFINNKQKNKRLINRTITVRLNSNNPINI